MIEGYILVQIWKTIIVSIAQICYKLTKEKLNSKLFDIYIYIIYIIYITYMYYTYYIYCILYIIYIYIVYIYIYIYNLLVNFYIRLTISSCDGSIPLTLGFIGRDGGLNTVCHSWGFACQQRVIKRFLVLAIAAPRMG